MKPQGQRPVQQRTSAPRSRQRTMPLLASWQHQHRADPRSSYLVRLPRSTHGLLCAIPRHDAVRRSQDSVVCCHQPRSRPARPQVSVAHASTDRRTADCCRWNPRCQPLMSLITLYLRRGAYLMPIATVEQPTKLAQDEKVQEQLWSWSEKALKELRPLAPTAA